MTDILDTGFLIFNSMLLAALVGAAVCLFLLIVKALNRYIRSTEVREEREIPCGSLGEVLKEHRLRREMTQEFVAETLGVSRQAVSKWERGTSVPSTSHLIALAKLYGVSSEELQKSVKAGNGDKTET